jgi:hypothetical protein
MAAPAAPFAPAPPPPPPSMVPPAASSFKIESPTGSIKIGLLAQPQFEALGSPTLDGLTGNFFVRRFCILLGGTLFKDFEYFVETDYPNLFKSQANADPMAAFLSKNSPGMNIQDALITWKAMGDMLKVDAGFMLPPMSHNSLQSAASLLAWDYFAQTFIHSNAFGSTNSAAPAQPILSPVGRDAGLQLRSLVAGGLVDARLGLFQGLRDGVMGTDVGGRNFPRIVGRLQVNLLDPETGMFYAGTYLGAKRILSIGGAFDIQPHNDFAGSYRYWDVDGIVDMPAGPGVVSGQINYAHWNGEGYVAIPKQSALMMEAGYRLAEIPIAPVVRYEQRFPGTATAALPKQKWIAGGLSFFPYGHNLNVKAFYQRIIPENPTPAPAVPLHGYNQFVVQWQLFFY